MLLSGVLEQENIDVKLFTVDEQLKAAYYPTNHFKHQYYSVMDHGCPVELRIRRNEIEDENAQPKALVNFQFYPRFPKVDDSLSLLEKQC